MVFEFTVACIYFYLPAALANVGASLSNFIPIFDRISMPIDLRKEIKGKRIIGDHKTYGGYIFGVLFGTTFGLIKYVLLDNYFKNYLLFEIDLIKTVFLYFLMSNGALIGDLAKSIIKRLLEIPPHSAWIPFDEIDHSVVSMLLAKIIVPISIQTYLTVVIAYFFLHVASNIIGFFLKIKKVPY